MNVRCANILAIISSFLLKIINQANTKKERCASGIFRKEVKAAHTRKHRGCMPNHGIRTTPEAHNNLYQPKKMKNLFSAGILYFHMLKSGYEAKLLVVVIYGAVME